MISRTILIFDLNILAFAKLRDTTSLLQFNLNHIADLNYSIFKDIYIIPVKNPGLKTVKLIGLEWNVRVV